MKQKRKTGKIFALSEGRRLTVKRFIAKFDSEERLKSYDIRKAVATALNMTKEELVETLTPQNANDPDDERQTEKIPILLQLIMGFVSKANNSVKDFLEVLHFAYPELARDVAEQVIEKNIPNITIHWTPPSPQLPPKEE
jgi:hypothetical protein